MASERIRDNLSLIQIEKLIKKLKLQRFKIFKPESDSFIYIEIKNPEKESYFPLCFIDSCYEDNYSVKLLNSDNFFLRNYNLEIRRICSSL
ncbi:hypothetical protein A3K82_00030 [Candidatus Pacearchaeota archaeon RBG_19FT_COMBO_34_9]|nr:MAG: hypothetical protein A3K82_00030 [Candidatus Pacearchaeota archaeon RBG_19FT_COMBO_34_9]OGJ15901.1 MAG: hypothetical protein A3K74_02265 [Candidatus Pacearchaeota archaeon RBG_13_33_26]